MPDSRFTPPDQPHLDALARSERFVDALATGQPVDDQADAADAALAALLADWRDEVRLHPTSTLVDDHQAAAALRSGPATRPGGRRGLRLAGSVAATVAAFGGFGAVLVGAQPGDALYGVHSLLFGEPQVSDDQIVLTANTELDQVEQMITQGQWEQAQDKLTAVGNRVQTVTDADRRRELTDHVNRLHAKVAARDPDATLPPGGPPGPGVAP
ncbi:anti-sigma-D factor RsdA [Mycobacterium sp.]|uniref:anti-sigma-D factor RsdA n=1 Tax=Mycobacterium sp. TaxID=1785 RepID=UPI0031D423B1